MASIVIRTFSTTLLLASLLLVGGPPLSAFAEGEEAEAEQILRYPGKLAVAQPKTAEGVTPLHLSSAPCEITPGEHDYVPMTRNGNFAIYPDPEGRNPYWYCLLEREVFNALLGRRPWVEEVPDDTP